MIHLLLQSDRDVCQSGAFPSSLPPPFLLLPLCLCFIFLHPLSLLCLFWHGHFHLPLWGLEMSPQEVLLCLSGSGRALWLWQTSFNWEEAGRVWKNWNIQETPFIRHNLNSAWKKPICIKKSQLPPCCESSPSSSPSSAPSRHPGSCEIPSFQFSKKCQSRSCAPWLAGQKRNAAPAVRLFPRMARAPTDNQARHNTVLRTLDLPQSSNGGPLWSAKGGWGGRTPCLPLTSLQPPPKAYFPNWAKVTNFQVET